MLKAGADAAATGENPVVVACRTADVIAGPVGIIAADAMMGEITPKMARAVGQSNARKILLPVNLCRIFIEEVFGENIPAELDDETLTTINKFFENNLNVSETSRQLFVHRNTLVYRIEKIQKSLGLDLRNFDDALTFKIALMVVNYMKYLDNMEY